MDAKHIAALNSAGGKLNSPSKTTRIEGVREITCTLKLLGIDASRLGDIIGFAFDQAHLAQEPAELPTITGKVLAAMRARRAERASVAETVTLSALAGRLLRSNADLLNEFERGFLKSLSAWAATMTLRQIESLAMTEGTIPERRKAHEIDKATAATITATRRAQNNDDDPFAFNAGEDCGPIKLRLRH